MKAWIAAATGTALLVTAGLAAAAGYVLFAVASVVLAVFAGVELVWTLRRRR